jgi:hypothetical protein
MCTTTIITIGARKRNFDEVKKLNAMVGGITSAIKSSATRER